MWRIARTVMVFLLLGAVVNVAVAWSMRPINGWNPAHVQVGEVFMVVVGPAGQSAMSVSHIVVYDTAYDHLLIERVVNSGISDIQSPTISSRTMWENMLHERYVGVYSSGWPWRALCYRIDFAPGAPKFFTGEGATISGGVPISSDRGLGFAARALPLIPLFPGALLNTCAYGVVLWVFFGMPITLRRMLRLRKRRCPSCGYPWGVSTTCTECGGDLSKWVRPDPERVGASPTP